MGRKPTNNVTMPGQDLSRIQAIVKAMNLEQQTTTAQKATQQKVVVIDPTQVWADASDTKAVANVDEGTVLKVVGKSGMWLQVQPSDSDVFMDWTKGFVKADAVTKAEDSADLYDLLVRSVEDMRQKYKNNPYITVTGFTVSVGIPPSVDINFDFK